MKFLSYKKIYLDYASATPINKDIQKKMSFYESHFFANPSSIHSSGVKVNSVIDEARKKIADLLFVSKNEIIFTGSESE